MNQETSFKIWDKKMQKMHYLTDDPRKARLADDYSLTFWSYGWELRGVSVAHLEETICGRHDKGRDDGVLIRYTGLKDKRGVGMYEGDVVRVKAHSFIVKWDERSARFLLRSVRRDEMNPSLAGCQLNGVVIGNIYENPELIKEVS